MIRSNNILLTWYRGCEANKREHRVDGGGGFAVIQDSDDIAVVHEKAWDDV